MVNAAEATSEHDVQNRVLRVNTCMDNAEGAEDTLDKKKTKKDKVRSAWISFAGRIVAQVVGAIATVALGVMVLHRYTSADIRPPASEPRHEAAQPSQPQVHLIVITPALMGVRDTDARARPADLSCAPALDSPATSAVHLNNETFRSR
jgi:hypothetical protein